MIDGTIAGSDPLMMKKGQQKALSAQACLIDAMNMLVMLR